MYIFYIIGDILAQAHTLYDKMVLGAQIWLLARVSIPLRVVLPISADWISRADVSEHKEVEAASLFLFIPQQM